MNYTKKKLEDMDVMDDFLMGQLGSDESYGTDFCRLIISTLLQKKIGRLRVSTQKVLSAMTPFQRGIRMDVQIEELGETVEGAEEEPELEYEDGLTFYYFYTGGTYGGNEALRTMLTYMQDSREENATDQTTIKLHSYVSRAKILPEVKSAYMKWDEYIYDVREDAVIETLVQSIQDILEDYGDIPESVKERLSQTFDKEKLRRWHKLAARVNSMEEFEDAISSGKA